MPVPTTFFLQLQNTESMHNRLPGSGGRLQTYFYFALVRGAIAVSFVQFNVC